MKILLHASRSAILLTVVIILVASYFTAPQAVFAESTPHITVASPDMQQGGSAQEGWDAFWAQFKVWLVDLALVFAQMPLVGPPLAGLLNFIGETNVWFCGAGLFIVFLLGAFAIRR